jgi:predicted PurR-regulated permease PerM
VAGGSIGASTRTGKGGNTAGAAGWGNFFSRALAVRLQVPDAVTTEPGAGMPGRSAAVAAARRLAVPLLIVLAVALMYAARAVLVPVALATLLAFLLTPLVTALHRRGLGRGLSVVVVALLVFAALGSAAWAISAQLTAVLADLPRYTEVVKARIATLRQAGRGGALERAQDAVEEVVSELEKDERAPRRAGPRPPVPVVVQEAPRSPLESIPELARRIAHVGLVLLLAVFILLERQELRNRIIRLMGYGRLTLTTRALDEAAARISRYLLTQCVLNGIMGGAFGAGLALIGVPYALLWGVVLAVARFVPFVGVWPAVLLPTALGVAVFPTWWQPALVLGWFLLLEVVIAGAVEPVVFSHRAGVSRVALLVAVAFWAWIWGPLGLVLAMPLTVCLVVLARHAGARYLLKRLRARFPEETRDHVLGLRPVLAAAEADARPVAAALQP